MMHEWQISTWKGTTHHMSLSSLKKKKDIATYLLKWPTSGTLVSRNAGEDMEQKELWFIIGGDAKWYSHFGGHFCSFLQK